MSTRSRTTQPETEQPEADLVDTDVNPKTAVSDDVPNNTVKDPNTWTTGHETMTGAQASYLKTLCEEAGAAFDPSLSKADASKMIDSLQAQTGRGRNH
ncbi:DUF3072 domain-containing protein [Acidisoma sp.]|uniref:DUF3072 domain-containing protein n=1 Tax=Acidisoma sp. TaxID=1872115 RepID=UPI003B00737E